MKFGWTARYETTGMTAVLREDRPGVEVTVSHDLTPEMAAVKIVSLLCYLPQNHPIEIILTEENAPLIREMCASGLVQTGGKEALGPIVDGKVGILAWSEKVKEAANVELARQRSEAKRLKTKARLELEQGN